MERSLPTPNMLEIYSQVYQLPKNLIVSLCRDTSSIKIVSEQTKQSVRRGITGLCVSQDSHMPQPHRSYVTGWSNEIFQEEVWLRDFPS